MTEPTLPGTVVFCHGLGGFNRWGAIHYFRHLHRAALGVRLAIPEVPATATIAQRATILATQLAPLPSPLHLVGHSMGGLDARYLAAHLDPDHRVATVTTLATPHRGSPLAPWLLQQRGLLPRLLCRPLLPALADLTPAACAAFNRITPDRDDVRYRSWGAARPLDQLPRWLHPWSRLLQHAEGDNDAQVSLYSANWGDDQGTLRADHFELLGWSLALPQCNHQRPFDHLTLYRQIIARLRQGG